MLTLQSTSLASAYRDTLQRLLTKGQSYEDPEIFREDAALIQLQNHARIADAPVLSNPIQDAFDYPAYFPHVTRSIVDAELTYWTREFFEKNKLPELIAYLQEFPLSKRAILLFWEDRYRDLSKSASCEVAAFFRIKGGRLHMHTHMRANNASFLLFMDMRILLAVQRHVADALGIPCGDYVHFIDSLHIYLAETDAAKAQLEFSLTSPLWKKL